MGSLTRRTVTLKYTMVRRSMKGSEKRGRGEDMVLVQIDTLHKSQYIRLGKFTLENIAKLLGVAHSDYIKILDFISNAKKGLDGAKSASIANTSFTGTVNSDDLVVWGKTFKQASPYMMYYSDYS